MDLTRDVVETLIKAKDLAKNKKPTQQQADGKLLEFREQQIESLGKFASYASLLQPFRSWDVSQNYIAGIPEDFAAHSRLEELHLSENLLADLAGLNGNMHLRVLNLSNNQLRRIEGLDNLPQLRVLVASPHQNLAANHLARLEGLDLPLLEELDLSHNDIERLENMDRLVSLKKLCLNRNKLADLDYLLLLGTKRLQALEACYNRLPLSYLDQLLELLAELQSLRQVSFAGNELALNKYYRLKLCSLIHLSHLDGILIKPYARSELKVPMCHPAAARSRRDRPTGAQDEPRVPRTSQRRRALEEQSAADAR